MEKAMDTRLRILVINGPNINMLGIREPEIYGADTYDNLLKLVSKTGEEAGIDVEVFQSNHEGDIVDRIQQAYNETDGIVINPAAYTHTSIAIADAISAVGIPAVEVHISDIDKREDFRKLSYVSTVAKKTIGGKGIEGYREAILSLAEMIQ